MTDLNRQHPDWLKVRFPGGKNYHDLKGLVRAHQLHTVCESANCPNIGECWNKSTATFMILGNICTRNCGFCAVQAGKPRGYDLEEPARVAKAVQILKLRHAVITSVDRDDLPDEGSTVFAQTVADIRKLSPATSVELLIPDFRKSMENLRSVITAHPDILGHNLDTMPRLFPKIKPKSSFEYSILVLKKIKELDPGIKTKTGFMLGLGEAWEEILAGMEAVIAAGVDILTLGQYLRPSRKNASLARHYTPAEFKTLKQIGEQQGIPHVEAGPLVRTSYHAAEQLGQLTSLSTDPIPLDDR